MKTDDAYGFNAVFTQQDMELVAAFRRIQKFRIKSVKDIRAGRMMNIRETHALRNAYCKVFDITGRPFRNKGEYSGFKVHVKNKSSHLFNKSEFTSTLISYNHGYKLNSKVEMFVELLLKADRFQQFCVLCNHPYTQKSFNAWRMRMRSEKEYDKFISDI